MLCNTVSQEGSAVLRGLIAEDAAAGIQQAIRRRQGPRQPGHQVGDQLGLRQVLGQALLGGVSPALGHHGIVHVLEQAVLLLDVPNEGLLVEILVTAPGSGEERW